jgi:endonuclease YncB( thermonuclease family)
VAKVNYRSKYLSSELIKNGLGWQYKKYSNSRELALLEQKARTQKIGFWFDPNPISASDWRKARRTKKWLT